MTVVANQADVQPLESWSAHEVAAAVSARRISAEAVMRACLDRMLDPLPVQCVFGHLGYVRADKGTATPGFQALLRLLRDGRAWVKLTGPYRISTAPLPHADTLPFAHALLETAPDRLVWGTDWPHVKTEWTIPMPNDGDLADLLALWVPDADTRRRVLVDNPARLYGFA